MTKQAALNGYTESEPFYVHLSKVNKLPYNGMTLSSELKMKREICLPGRMFSIYR